MGSFHVALATQHDLPEWEKDDQPFHASLSAHGITHQSIPWDDTAARWEDFDAVLLRTTWDYMEKAEAFAAWIQDVAQRSRLLNPLEAVTWNLSKTYLKALQAKGVPVAPTLWVEGPEDTRVEAWLRDQNAERGFIKPVVGCCAWETLRFTCDDAGLAQAHTHLERAQAAGGMMIQPYLPRVEVDGEISALFFGGHYSHGVQKIPVAGDYRVQDDFGATDRPYHMSAEERAIAEHAVRAAEQLIGQSLLYARVDLMWDRQDELVLTELELIEPSLFFRHDPSAPDRLTDALIATLKADQ